MAALFTTTEVFRQVLIELAHRPEYVEPLREEISGTMVDGKITGASLVNMQLLDSFMKESQRQIPQLVIMERLVTRDTRLPDGAVYLEELTLGLSVENWNHDILENPNHFDGRRFLKPRQAGDSSGQFVQSSPEHAHFGMGKHQCPGCFFAGSELKLCLADIVLQYNIRLKEGYSPQVMQNGFMTISDPFAHVQVRRR